MTVESLAIETVILNADTVTSLLSIQLLFFDHSAMFKGFDDWLGSFATALQRPQPMG